MIKIAEISGTCFGVTRAIDIALSVGGREKKAYVYKEICHNANVINTLKENGVECVDSLDGLEDSIIVVRAHGEAKSTYEYLDKKGFEYYDATCLNVVKIHEIIEEKYKKNYSIIIIGLKAHVEVIGSNGWCNNEGILVETLEDIDNIKDLNDNVLIICHTTFNEDKANKLVGLIKEKFPDKNIEFVDSICRAQRAIQISSRKLAEKCDLMIVIGGENSTNSKELLRVCKECCNSYKFADIKVFEKWLKEQTNIDKTTNIGITAGASVMKHELNDYKNLVEDYLKSKDYN